MSKKWKRRLRKVNKIALKVGIVVAGAALSTVTLGASAVLATAALAALAKRDQAKAAQAKAKAAAAVATGEDPLKALINAILSVQAPADINGMLTGGVTPPGQVDHTAVIQAQLGMIPGTALDSGGSSMVPAAPTHGVPVPAMFAYFKGR